MTIQTTTVDPVFHQSEGLYDLNDPSPNSGIIPLQSVPSDPSLPTLQSTSGLITPDQATGSRLAHFPEDLYDLSPTSHLSRFLKALLGDSGAGQLRKRLTVTRFESTLTGSHFFDLDGFYGAIFGATRNVAEQLTANPMASTATPEEWDDISQADASFQDRINALARAISLGATIPGLQAAAEALTGVECDVYETWQILDLYGIGTVGKTWDQAEAAYADWAHIEAAGETWDSFTGAFLVGGSGTNSRSEVIVRPKKNYDPVSGDVGAFREAERVRLEDERSIQRVLNVLKPAGVLISVDNNGVAMHIPAAIAALVSDSDYWEVLTKVRPNPSLTLTSNPYPISPVKSSIGILENGELRPLPVPPFVDNVGLAWSYNAQITAVTGYMQPPALSPDPTKTPGPGLDASKLDFETVPTAAGPVTYPPANGLLDVRAIAAAAATADNALQAHPYSGPRVVVPGA